MKINQVINEAFISKRLKIGTEVLEIISVYPMADDDLDFYLDIHLSNGDILTFYGNEDLIFI